MLLLTLWWRQIALGCLEQRNYYHAQSLVLRQASYLAEQDQPAKVAISWRFGRDKDVVSCRGAPVC
jgi:hypothetical protein